MTGIIERTNSGVDVKELPIRVWTQAYKEQIEEWLVGNDKVPQLVKVCLPIFNVREKTYTSNRITKSITRPAPCISSLPSRKRT